MDKKRLIINATIGIGLSALYTVGKTIYIHHKKEKEHQSVEQIAQKQGFDKMTLEDARLMNDGNWHDAEKALKVSGRYFRKLEEERKHDGGKMSERKYQYYYHALQWLKRAAALGDPRAKVMFLVYAEHKLPPGIEYTQAEQDRYKATVLNELEDVTDKQSQHWYAMGVCYEMGYGVEVNVERARELKNKAKTMLGQELSVPKDIMPTQIP